MTAERPTFIVLLSGGLDSVVNMYEAELEGPITKAITFNYGQKSALKEIAAAKFFCEELSVDHLVLELDWLGGLTNTALVSKEQSLPVLKNLDDNVEATASAKAVWVPNRNGVFLNIAASFAESLGARYVVPGFNKEEAQTFPDNSKDYAQALNQSFALSTLSKVTVKCYTLEKTKAEILTRALKLGVDVDKLWSCYEGGKDKCRTCESCQRTMRALDVVGL
jgi:7-cyano-7-deazaguanine synthase